MAGLASKPEGEARTVTTLEPLRRHPHLFQINTWAWLERLSKTAGRQLGLADVPESEWDRLRDLGFDIVYLLGVWTRSPAGRRIARSDPALFSVYDRALPGWTLNDVAGSPFSIQAYAPDERIGTWGDLDAVRAHLHARGMRLLLDFVPNHTGPDHRWITMYPQYFIQGREEDYRRDPAAFHYIERNNEPSLFIARGRDPYFAPWSDTAQLDHFNAAARAALIETLQTIAQHCDGVRCDMAMLALNDVFARTWARLLGDRPWPREEFWTEAIGAVRADFLWIAEVYWDLESRVLDLGFDYAYDKRLYDCLKGSAGDLRRHLSAGSAHQARLARFIENHDEHRSVAAFGKQRIPGLLALLAGVPGLRFLHDGQFEGRSIHLTMQLAHAADEQPDPDLAQLYVNLLAIADTAAFHEGDWKLLPLAPDCDGSHANLIACRWRIDADYWLIVVNLASTDAQGRLRIAEELIDASGYTLTDVLDDMVYVRDRTELLENGLYVRLRGYAAHFFRIESAPPA